MLDARVRFTETADAYDRYRPGYPAAVPAWMAGVAGLAPGARVLDLGCGTGIASRLFAAAGFAVVGIDPNDAMLAHARARAGGPRYQAGEAAATGLPAASFDLAIAAQAFHWFDLDDTLAELARVLVPGGWACAFWNSRDGSEFNDAWDALIERYSREYRELKRRTGAVDRLRAHPRVRDFCETRFINEQRLDRAACFGRAESSSYVAHGVEDRAAFDAELGALFERFADGDVVRMSYSTETYAWRAGG